MWNKNLLKKQTWVQDEKQRQNWSLLHQGTQQVLKVLKLCQSILVYMQQQLYKNLFFSEVYVICLNFGDLLNNRSVLWNVCKKSYLKKNLKVIVLHFQIGVGRLC